VAKKPSKGKKPADKSSKTPQAPATEAPASVATQAAQPQAKTEAKEIDLSAPDVREAIKEGQGLIKNGKSKADAAQAIYGRLKTMDKELVTAAFVSGAGLTPKGAVTYWYNCKRKAERAAEASST
jgi:hypothetical protein